LFISSRNVGYGVRRYCEFGVISIKDFERAVASDCDGVVVGEFCYREPVYPIVLSVGSEESQILFDFVKVILKGNGSEGLQPQLVRCAPFPSIAPYFRML